METLLIYYLTAANVLAFLLYGIDKYKAIKNRWRIPEKKLLGIAALGGSAGALLGMWIFSHKTLHKKFAWGVPLLLCLQLALGILCYQKFY